MQYDLVFEGGGAKGMVFAGAMDEFFSRGHTYKRVLGTSAGAITATLLAAGYQPPEMMAALNEKDDQGRSVFTEFMGVPPPLTKNEIDSSDIRLILGGVNSRLIPDFIERRIDDAIANWMARSSRFINLFAFVQRGGWYSADAFITWLSRKLDEGSYNGKPRKFSGMTLSQFFDATQIDLTVIASDVTARQILILNHRTAPALPVVYAVRMSMGIPLLWNEIKWQAAWGQYRNRDMTNHAIVDGGMLSNFPIELLVSDERFVTNVMGPKQTEAILGCLIDTKLDVPNAGEPESEEKRFAAVGNLKTVHRLHGLMETSLEARDKTVIEAFEELVVRCPAKGYGTIEFDMSDKRRAALVEAGRAAMAAHLTRPESDMGQSRGLGEDRSAEIATRLARSILGD